MNMDTARGTHRVDTGAIFLMVPPEIVIEQPSELNGFYWVWAVCQPDAAWGEIAGGRAGSREQAGERAHAALNRELFVRRLEEARLGIQGNEFKTMLASEG